jgi:hypothetical protein
MGINEAGHEEFPFLQTNESDIRKGTIMLRQDIVELCILYILDEPFDVALWRNTD